MKNNTLTEAMIFSWGICIYRYKTAIRGEELCQIIYRVDNPIGYLSWQALIAGWVKQGFFYEDKSERQFKDTERIYTVFKRQPPVISG